MIVPLAFLRRLTALLVDVHGQHAHQSLLDAKNHMAFLDSFGDAAFEAQKRRVEERYHLWRESSGRFSMLRKENEQRAQQQEYLQTRVRELDAVQLAPGETERLTAERARFASAERMRRRGAGRLRRGDGRRQRRQRHGPAARRHGGTAQD